jgi:hypothetical protein
MVSEPEVGAGGEVGKRIAPATSTLLKAMHKALRALFPNATLLFRQDSPGRWRCRVSLPCFVLAQWQTCHIW